MSSFQEYEARYDWAQIEREAGILQVTLHSNGDSLRWNRKIHRELPELFAAIGADPENRVLILTGAGRDFCDAVEPYTVPEPKPLPRPGLSAPGLPADIWDRTYSEGKRLLINLLDIEIPVIGVVNGPAHLHAEIVVLSDIVLAAEHASFRDPHMARGVVAGDGVQILWPMLLGENRGRYFLLTSQVLPADEALALGVVNEVLPTEDLLPRAWEHARALAALPPLVTRYSRVAMTQELRRRVQADLGYGLALEGLAASAGRGDWDQSTPVIYPT